MTDLLCLILGLLIGYYGRSIYDRLNLIYEQKKDQIEARNVGVVRPVGIAATRNQPIDMSSDTGPVMRPRPSAVEDDRQNERARILRENHR